MKTSEVATYQLLEGAKAQIAGKEPKERPPGEHGINQHEVPHAGYTVVGDKPIKILSFYMIDGGAPPGVGFLVVQI